MGHNGTQVSNVGDGDPDGALLGRVRLATLLLASTLTVMAGATIVSSLPAIGVEFAATPGVAVLVPLVLTLPALFVAVGAPVAGVAVDRVGRRPLLVGGLVLYAAAGVSGFVLDSLGTLLVGRALLGVAVAALMTSATTLVADYYDGARRDAVMGYQGAAMAFGGVLFLPLGGVLADVGWRFPFLVYGASLLLLPAALWSLPEPADACDPRYRFDPQACDLATGVRLTDGGAPTDGGTLTISRRALLAVYATALVGMLAFFAIPVQLPFYLAQLADSTGTSIGLTIAVGTLTAGVASTQFQRVRRRLDVTQVVAATFGLLAVGFWLVGVADDLVGVVAGLAISGVGLGLLGPNLNGWLAANAPEARRGQVLGGLTSVIFVGQFCSPLVLQPVVSSAGYASTFLILGGAMLGFGTLAVGITMYRWLH